MRTKTIINGNGERQATCIEIPLEGDGGALGMHAIKGLTEMIAQLKEEKEPDGVVEVCHMIYGYTVCCLNCGFLTEKSANDLMHAVEGLAQIELERAERQQAGEGKA